MSCGFLHNFLRQYLLNAIIKSITSAIFLGCVWYIRNYNEQGQNDQDLPEGHCRTMDKDSWLFNFKNFSTYLIVLNLA